VIAERRVVVAAVDQRGRVRGIEDQHGVERQRLDARVTEEPHEQRAVRADGDAIVILVDRLRCHVEVAGVDRAAQRPVASADGDVRDLGGCRVRAVARLGVVARQLRVGRVAAALCVGVVVVVVAAGGEQEDEGERAH